MPLVWLKNILKLNIFYQTDYDETEIIEKVATLVMKHNNSIKVKPVDTSNVIKAFGIVGQALCMFLCQNDNTYSTQLSVLYKFISVNVLIIQVL